MNINQIPDPPIKPTRTPRIVKDQDKEARFAAGQSLGGPLTQSNPNAQPSKGGLIAGITKYLEEQQVLAQTQSRQTTAQNPTQRKQPRSLRRPANTSDRKNSSSIWVAVFLGVWIIFGLIGSIAEDAFDTTSDNQIDPSTLVTTTPPPANDDTADFSRQNDTCVSLELPASTTLNTTGTNSCNIDFDGGYSQSRTAFVRFDGTYFYESAEDYLNNRIPSVEIAREYTVDDIQVYELGEVFGFTEYVFWVRDRGVQDDNSERIESVSLYLSNLSYEEQQQETIVTSVEFHSPSDSLLE